MDDIPPKDPGDVLSQAEVEKLLAEIASQENAGAPAAAPAGTAPPAQHHEPAPTVVHKSGGVRWNPPPEAIHACDFRQPSLLAAGELRRLRQRHEEFVRAMAARLSVYLRMEFVMQMTRLQTVPFHRFIAGLSTPTHLTLFKVEPLRGLCLLDIAPRLGAAMVDRLLGGPARMGNLERDLSEIEVALLDQAVQISLQEWCSHWAGVMELRQSVLGHENNGRFVQAISSDALMVTLTMEARLGECQGSIQMAFPYEALEPLLRKLTPATATKAKVPAAAPAPPRWNAQLNQARLRVTAGWNGMQMTFRDVTRLQAGDVLQLHPNCAGQVQVRLGSLPKFIGRLGVMDKKWAVELTQTLKS